MPKNNSNIAHRAWKLLRLALLWASKGGVFKRRLVMDLRIIPNFIKTLGHSAAANSIRYGERQLSFDDTPIIHFKMHRPQSMRFRLPHIPCINPRVDFDYEFDQFGDDEDDEAGVRRSFVQGGDHDEECANGDQCEEDGSIDEKAEEFIAKFYRQIKLQRQISYLEYN